MALSSLLERLYARSPQPPVTRPYRVSACNLRLAAPLPSEGGAPLSFGRTAKVRGGYDSLLLAEGVRMDFSRRFVT